MKEGKVKYTETETHYYDGVVWRTYKDRELTLEEAGEKLTRLSEQKALLWEGLRRIRNLDLTEKYTGKDKNVDIRTLVNYIALFVFHYDHPQKGWEEYDKYMREKGIDVDHFFYDFDSGEEYMAFLDEVHRKWKEEDEHERQEYEKLLRQASQEHFEDGMNSMFGAEIKRVLMNDELCSFYGFYDYLLESYQGWEVLGQYAVEMARIEDEDSLKERLEIIHEMIKHKDLRVRDMALSATDIAEHPSSTPFIEAAYEAETDKWEKNYIGEILKYRRIEER